MQIRFEAVAEAEPGAKWQGLFQRHWGAYQTWFLSEGDARRPSFLQSRRMLREHMPELLPTYERLVELAGGGDLAARFLALYRPPPYISGCSQAIWPAEHRALLVRNYDYSPALCEGTLLYSCWNGRRVIAMGDSLWGVLDGMNEAGLVVSLSFGGRRVVGDGFGVPLILRYVLEFCESTEQATDALERIPTHMSYNVTVLDRDGRFQTAFLAPDRPPVVRQLPAATNHQGRIEWHEHAEATSSLKRERFLLFRLADSDETEDGFLDAFLQPPLYSTSYGHGFGTLYTALYRPLRGVMAVRWPGETWEHSFERFDEGVRTVRYRQRQVAAVAHRHARRRD